MIHQLLIKNGDVFGIQYTFTKPGEGIPMHMHEADSAHTVKVLEGSIAFYGPDGTNLKVVMKGTTHSFDWSQQHEIMALEPNTVIFNQFLNGMPEGYDDLPPEEKEWTKEEWKLTVNNVGNKNEDRSTQES